MVRANITIGSTEGIHLIPASKIAALADQYTCKIHIKKDHMDLNAKSIISIVSGMMLKGDVVVCECDGPDEKEALKAMQELLVLDLK